MIKKDIYALLGERILVLDGGLGTMVQGFGLEEADYRGERFAGWEVPLKGCNDLLALTAPDVIARIHRAYLSAGADIISTDSFNATSVSLADYRLSEHAYEINRAAAGVAWGVADEFTLRNPTKPRFVAGSMGPTGKTASMSADVNDPGAREVSFDDLAAAYREQVRGLLDGGVDILLVETIFDTLNAKAAVFAIQQESERRGLRVPVMISGTLADAGGRTLSGQTVEAFYTSLAHAEPITVGLNCAFGARQMLPFLRRLAGISEYGISAHPNAGLPNLMGGYDETPQMMADDVEEYMRLGLVNIVGGCCGTTPAHIAEFALKAAKYPPRGASVKKHVTMLSGLEPLKIAAESNFVNVGERTNVAGSARFAKMIREGRYDDALSVAREQVDAGAQIIDVCMDDGLIDGVPSMSRFLNLMMSEPEISRVPVMIDSSSWEVLQAGLKCVQGKSIVNSISLKEGEAEFVEKARKIREFGAAVVVMLFDEKGQADTYRRKIEVARRAYDLLIEQGFPPEDIVFDPNVLSVATGIEEHNTYAVDFIEAVRWIKQNLPHAKVSGGVSNLSFAFRGNNKVREAMHSVFLYHAIAAGMDMGIVNPAMLQVYSEIEPELLELTEDVVLNRRPDATERLATYAETVKGEKTAGQTAGDGMGWRLQPLAARIAYALKKGLTDHIEDDIREAYRVEGTPLGVIDNMLMPAMGDIGELFGQGKMFLPQVVKSARVMRRAVDVLTPYLSAGETSKPAGSVVIATVKGDVHDIGKNIVSVVMSCNGYRVEDLGVMVDAEVIADAVERTGADALGLSGLISPSLEEMIKVVAELERRGISVPVIIGGATTSALHTAVKIAPVYSGAVIHSRDASENITILNKLAGPARDEYIQGVREKQSALKWKYENEIQRPRLIPLDTARANRHVKSAGDVITPLRTGRIVMDNYDPGELAELIDWNFFFPAWGIRGRYPQLFESPDKGEQARRLLSDAKQMLDRIAKEGLLRICGVAGIYPARSHGDDIFVEDGKREYMLSQLRNQENGKAENLSLADFVAASADHVGAFVVSAGVGVEQAAERFRAEGDDYSAIMLKLLADRLTEAFAERMHSIVRRELWGFETGGAKTPEQILAGDYQGIRAAFGYPACPDHSLKRDVFELLGVEGTLPLEITGNYMIRPGEALCGLIFADPGITYFNVGRIDPTQLEDYSARRGMSPDEMARLIPNNIG